MQIYSLQESTLASTLASMGKEKDKNSQSIVLCRDTSFLPLDVSAMIISANVRAFYL